jgi:hypothetical protein
MPRTAATTIVTNPQHLTRANIGDTIHCVQKNIRTSETTAVDGVIESVSNMTSVRVTRLIVDGKPYAVGWNTRVELDRAADREEQHLPAPASTTANTRRGFFYPKSSDSVPAQPGRHIKASAGDITARNIGHHIDLRVGGATVYGKLDGYQSLPAVDMVTLTIEGQDFTMPLDKPLTIIVPPRR